MSKSVGSAVMTDARLLFVCFIVCGISLMSSQLIVEVFPVYLRVMLFALCITLHGW